MLQLLSAVRSKGPWFESCMGTCTSIKNLKPVSVAVTFKKLGRTVH
jgi:hypothetical protein